MNLNQHICTSIIIIFNLIGLGISSDKTCGTLKPHCVGTVCKIRLYSSTEMDEYIRKLQYRWVKNSLSNMFQKVILQKDNQDSNYDRDKYPEENLTLQINNMGKSDEGLYKVECWVNRDDTNTFVVSDVATIHWPLVTTTVAPPGEGSKSTESPSSVDTATLVTIAVCSLIIVVIISATVCIVVRRKQTQDSIEGERRLFNREDTSEGNHGHRVDIVSTVYNEIDDDVRGAQAAIGNDYKPAIPIDCKTENVYDMIIDTDEAEVNIKHDNVKASNDNLEIPVYAQVNKKRKDDNGRLKRKDNKGWLGECADGGYVVMFPNINCSEIALSLGKDYEVMSYPEPKRGGPQYANFVSRSQRLKSRKARNSSRKELQYAILDHPDSDSESVVHNIKDTEPAFTPCQYALIDFNKKAFIAPLRKAPSSWYKRKNKKNRSKK